MTTMADAACDCPADGPDLVSPGGTANERGAWADNSTSTGDNPDGSAKLDIRTARIAP